MNRAVSITRSDLSTAELQQAALHSPDYRLSCRLPAAGTTRYAQLSPKEAKR
jgi:hypothetical protein